MVSRQTALGHDHWSFECEKFSNVVTLDRDHYAAVQRSIIVKNMFVCLFRFLTSSSTTRLYRGRPSRLTSDNYKRCNTRGRTGRPCHDFCLSRSHYTDTDPTRRERAAAAGIEPGTSSPGVAPPTG